MLPESQTRLQTYLQEIEHELQVLREAALGTKQEQLYALKASRDLARAATSLNYELKNLVLNRGIRSRERLMQRQHTKG